MKFVQPFVFLVCVFATSFTSAQLLPNNNLLTVQTVQRWMDSNRDMASVIQLLDEMNATEEDIKKFDDLPVVEQDQKINAYLQKKNVLVTANSLAARHGWKSVGEYMRLSTKLGNAIAAYFVAEEIKNLTADQKQQVKDKTDPAVLAVSKEDIAFVKANEKLLKDYIQAYSSGR